MDQVIRPRRYSWVLIILLIDLQVVQEVIGVISLSSKPPPIGGTLTVRTGNEISLTCSHDNDNNGVTRWIFGPPVDCSQLIDHNNPSLASPCGPFEFHNVSMLSAGAMLSSTAVASAVSSMTGSAVMCRDSAGQTFDTSNAVTLCVTEYPQPPSNVSWSLEGGDSLVITWNPWTQPQCSSDVISYTVMIGSLSPTESQFHNITTSLTRVEVSDVLSNTTYLVIVRTAVGFDLLQSETASTLTFTTATGEVITDSTTTQVSTDITEVETVTTTSVSESCSCDKQQIMNCSASLSDQQEALVAVAVSAAVVIAVCVVSFITFVVIFCCARNHFRQPSDMDSSCSTSLPRPVYEEITLSKDLPTEVIKVEENVAYGQTPGKRNARSNTRPT